MATVHVKQRKAGRGAGNEATLAVRMTKVLGGLGGTCTAHGMPNNLASRTSAFAFVNPKYTSWVQMKL